MLAFRRGYAALLKDRDGVHRRRAVCTGDSDSGAAPAGETERSRADGAPRAGLCCRRTGSRWRAASRTRDRGRTGSLRGVRRSGHWLHAPGESREGTRRRRARRLAHPSYGPAYETLGLILWRGGDPHAAVAAFDKSVQLDPRNARALVWMGMVYTNTGRTADALAAFQHATRTDPTSVDAWIGIANAEMNRHDLDAAAEALHNAQRLQPDRPVVKQTAERLQSLQPAARTGRITRIHEKASKARHPRVPARGAALHSRVSANRGDPSRKRDHPAVVRRDWRARRHRLRTPFRS